MPPIPIYNKLINNISNSVSLSFRRMPPESGLLFAVVDDSTNKYLFGIDTTFKLVGPTGLVGSGVIDPEIIARLTPTGLSYSILPKESGWALALPTTDGKRACGFSADGTVMGNVTPNSPINKEYLVYPRLTGTVPLLSDASRIVVLGDSTGEGAGASTASARWHYLLGQALGVPIVNLGIGGQTSSHIAGRFDAIPVTITVSGNLIPADTSSVSVTSLSVDLLNNGSGTSTRTMPVTILGIPITLTKTGGTTYSLARNTAGSAIACPAGTLVHADYGTTYANDTLIICAGTNDRGGDIYTAMQNILAIVKRTSPYFKRVLVASPRGLTGTDVTGTTANTNLLRAERIGRQMFGDNWLDLRRFLIDDAMDYLGLTKTSTDLSDIAADCIPRSLLDDFLHSNDSTHQAEAAFYQWALTGRGYF